MFWKKILVGNLLFLLLNSNIPCNAGVRIIDGADEEEKINIERINQTYNFSQEVNSFETNQKNFDTPTASMSKGEFNIWLKKQHELGNYLDIKEEKVKDLSQEEITRLVKNHGLKKNVNNKQNNNEEKNNNSEASDFEKGVYMTPKSTDYYNSLYSEQDTSTLGKVKEYIQKNKKIIIPISVLSGGGILFLLFKRKKKKSEQKIILFLRNGE